MLRPFNFICKGGVIVNDNNYENKAETFENNICAQADTHDDSVDLCSPESQKDSESFKSFIFDWLEVLVHAIIAVVICFSFLFRIATIDGPALLT